MSRFTEIEEELTVDQMIGVLKWIKKTEKVTYTYYQAQLEDWSSEGYGEVTVASCKDTLCLPTK